MRTYFTKHLVNKSITLPSLLLKKIKNDWKGKPTTWPDIRKNAQDNHIYLLVDARYPIGFTAAATGGYCVKIDGVYYDDYSSQAQFAMSDWSSYTETEGYSIDYPTGATTAHILDIYPKNSSEHITGFNCQKTNNNVSSESQGILWINFQLNNSINLNNLCSPYPYNYSVPKLEAITSKNNILNLTRGTPSNGTFHAQNLKYIPTIKNITITSVCFEETKLEKIVLIDPILGHPYSSYCFALSSKLKEVIFKNPTYIADGMYNFYFMNTMLKRFPDIDWSKVKEARDMWSDYNPTTNDGEPTVIDASAGKQIKILGLHDTKSLIGLRVSNEAPFDSSVSPQINIKSTSLDKSALVTLFNDLPTVTDGQIINITDCLGTPDLTDDDKAIATNKGWTIAL